MKSIFFADNRHNLAKQIGQGIVVLSAYHQMQRGNDAAFEFEQEANFWYLTGINAPDWRLIIDGKTEESWLVEPAIDEVHRIFNGGLSPAGASTISGIKAVISHSEAEKLLKELAKDSNSVYTLGKDMQAEHYDFVQNPAQHELGIYLKHTFKEVKDCRTELAKLRAIKQPEEIIAIKKAITITIEAFEIFKQKLPDLKYEYEVEAEFDYYFSKNGTQGHAYDPIVASGDNAWTLHYNKNQDILKKDSLLLLDIGARADGYAADISRTYTVGTSTARQIAVHSAVESAQQQIIMLLKPGLKVRDYQAKVDIIMQSALDSLGLKHKTPDESRAYFPHAISHGLGIDVHDSLGKPDTFLSGMVLTVEPGIYIPEEGIGVRIEDDILITDTGHENLSAALSTSL